MITQFQISMLEAIHMQNHIPLWIFDQDNHYIASFFPDLSDSMNRMISSHILKLISLVSNHEFSIFCAEKEYYCVFHYSEGKEMYNVVMGPMLLTGLYRTSQMRELSFSYGIETSDLKHLVENLPIISLTEFASSLDLCRCFLTEKRISYESLSQSPYFNLDGQRMQHGFHSYFLHPQFEVSNHTPYSHELAILHCVRDGDYRRLESTYRTLPKIRYGSMSQDALKQLLYGCIANTTLVTRYAIEGGMNEEDAFCFSDFYIRQMAASRSLYELNLLNEHMAIDFTKKVSSSKRKNKKSYSRPIHICLNHIATNLYQKITVKKLSEITGLNPNYLSTRFHTETGSTLKQYIEEKRIEEAKKLLLYTDQSYIEIAQLLAFHSQSYFIQIFKKHTELTPAQYKNQYRVDL